MKINCPIAGSVVTLLFALGLNAASPTLPVRGLHIMAPKPDEMDLAVRFIREGLPKVGVNTLVMEFDYQYKFTRRPEVADSDALSKDDVKKIVAACRDAGVQLIPQINLLGHQSWASNTGGLLRSHPELDETPGKYPQNAGIYCRSYCPLHPKVHEIVFDLIDEIAEVTEAHAFHAGMDEVFFLGENDCERCRGKNKAELFAGEVKAVHDHLAQSGRTLWIWGDRFLDGATTGMGKWEASANGTQDAIRMVPKDIVICDWHYERVLPSITYFAMEGFPVLACPWRKPNVALGQLAMVRDTRAHATGEIAGRMQGVLQTTWVPFGSFAKAYFGEQTGDVESHEVVQTFRAVFEEIGAAQ
ncbi:MAG TPA: family 20 glycosylhydrolase [Bryobacteraceae bacterium]|nr:family 20 glycosylhydrolase [Bryobacteraceae bacterium]